MVHNCCSQWWSLVSYAFYSTKFDTFGHDKYISHVENMDYLRSIIAVCSLRTSAWRPEAHSYGDFLRQHSCRVLDKTNGRPLAVGDKRAATARPIGMRQRHNHLGATKVASIVGKINDMADIASRVFNEKFPAHLLDSPFQYYFSEKNPLQDESWNVAHPNGAIVSAVTLTLEGRRLPLQHWTKTSESKTGGVGSTGPESAASTPSSQATPQQSSKSSSLASLTGSGQATTAKAIALELKPWKRRAATFCKPSSWLEAATQEDSVPEAPPTT